MTHFLVEFDRLSGKLIDLRRFESSNDALSGRFQAERRHPRGSSIEVVVLSAESETDLRRTHARYFMSATQLVEGLSTMAQTSVTRSTLGGRSRF